MSFGWSATEVVALAKLAYTTVQHCRKACGEYDDLTRQVESLCGVIEQLRHEGANTKSLLNRPGKDSCWKELRPSLDGSREVLRAMNEILVKYASINRKDKVIRRLWTRAKFGNKELSTLNDLRQKARFYTRAISTLVNTVAVGSLGRIENSLDEAGLRDIKPAIEVIACRLAAMNHADGSVLTAYSKDDRAVWKELRRELVKENIVPSDIISRNKDLITQFIRELGERGVLDDGEVRAPETPRSGLKKLTRDAGRICIDPETKSSSGQGKSSQEEAVDLLQWCSQTLKQDDVPIMLRHDSDIDSDNASLVGHCSCPTSVDGLSIASSKSETGLDTLEFSETGSEERCSNNGGTQWRAEEGPVHQIGLDHHAEGKHVRSLLSIDNMLRLDLSPRMNELVACVLFMERHQPIVEDAPICCMFDLERWDERPHIIFIGTPWGLFLSACVHNLSLSLENLKFFFGLLGQGLRSARSAELSSIPKTGALNDGEIRFSLRDITNGFRDCQASAVSELNIFANFCNRVKYDLPVIYSLSQLELSEFCQQYLQQTYDYASNLQPSTAHLEHFNKCLHMMVSLVELWMADFHQNCADNVRFIMRQTNALRNGSDYSGQWIQQCQSTDRQADYLNEIDMFD